MQYPGSDVMPVGDYRDAMRSLPPLHYGHTVPDSLKHHRDQIYGSESGYFNHLLTPTKHERVTACVIIYCLQVLVSSD